MLMLALRRQRCLLHSAQSSQTRYLRTQPREIPTYARKWDPTRHKPLHPNQALDEPRPDAPEHCLLKSAVDELRHTKGSEPSIQDIIIERQSRNPQIAHGIKRLQYLLNLANTKDGSNSELRAPLWKAYCLAKQHRSTLPTHLPQRAWEVLWQSQYADFSDMSRRKARLAELNHDLLMAKAPQIAGQVIYNIERKFMAGKEQRALEEWELNRHILAMKPEFLDTGARLYALAGYPNQALDAMDRLFQLSPHWDSSIMMAVFRAHTSSNLEQHHEKAKEIYHAMKVRIGPSITIETYDSCLVGFLEAKSLSCAKQVFRDMVRDGCLGTEGYVWRADEVLRRLHLLYTLGTNISSMTSIALDAVALLPPAYHGHIFGDWMKSAVVEQAPQAAAQILDIMIQRGYEPEVFHFNMLLRALLRTNESSNILKAENLGWKMIEEARLSMHKGRPAPQSRVQDIERRLKDFSVLDSNPTIIVPAASVSTFALIMHHHAKQLQWEHVDYLARQLKLANIEPNTKIMNVLVDNKCRQGKFIEAWQIYKSLTDNPDSSTAVFPDGESIRCLWKTLRIALADPTVRDNPGLPTPRELLRETVHWWTLCRSRYDADRFFQGLAAKNHGAITGLIMHCFSYTQDLAGSLIALHVLRHRFNIFPTNKVAEILQRQVAWVDMREETESVRLQFGSSKNNAKNLERAVRAYRQLGQRRFEALNITPDTVKNYSKERMADLELNILSEFIRAVLIANYSPEIVEAMIDAARNVIGVPDLSTGDVTAFDMANPN